MFTKQDEDRIFNIVEQLGLEVMSLAKNKHSFGSFFLEGYSDEIMTYLPYYQQSIWGVPMNYENTVFWEYHQYGQLEQIKNYDFAIIFKHQTGKTNTIFLKPASEYGKDKYYIVIQSIEDSDVGSMMFPFTCQFMSNNPYLWTQRQK